MDVFKVMTRDVVWVTPEVTLMEAARTMRDLGIGSLPVCEGYRLLGMVTDRDITVRATAEGFDPRETPLGDVMSTEVVCCHEADDIRSAAMLMQDAQLRRLLVVNDNGRLVGIVSLGDLALQSGDERLAGETLEKVSEPTKTESRL